MSGGNLCCAELYTPSPPRTQKIGLLPFMVITCQVLFSVRDFRIGSLQEYALSCVGNVGGRWEKRLTTLSVPEIL